MGAWGLTALESDQGLDVVDFVKRFVSNIKAEPVNLDTAELIDAMKKDGFFGQNFEEVDFYFDNSAMALAELYLMFKHSGKLDYEDENQSQDLAKRVKSFVADKAALSFILRYLNDIKLNEIKSEKPDKHGNREIIELWRESNNWDEWKANLNNLIEELTAEMNH
jgi:Domain of unknown function (DUF4259)